MGLFGRKKKVREKLLQQFGKAKEDYFDFDRIDAWFRKKVHKGALQTISDKTCNDLDFRALFMFVDRTNSRIGQQFLYDRLRTIPASSKDNAIHEELIKKFTNNAELRLTVQEQLSKLNEREAFYIAPLLREAHLKPPKWFFVVPLLSFASLLSLLLMLFNPQIFLVFIAVLLANIVIHYWNKRNLFRYVASMPQLLKLNSVAKKLHKIDELKEINPNLQASLKVMDKVCRRISFFRFDATVQSDLVVFFWAILELLKLVFLLEPLLLFAALKQLEDKRSQIEDVFCFAGQVDCLISIASLRNGLDNFCIPEIIEGQKHLSAENIYHPLIPGCITNSVEVSGKSILLTGSNMSGKTSFIRAMGINALTAQTINTCFATRFTLPRMRIFSAIRISDDLLNDKSYYFEEVLTIKEMISESTKPGFNLFLLDEIFKGTNTLERISAGKAVLSYLAKNENMVFVSTHDVELADLLQEEYELYHFSESVENKTVDFDYKLKPGKLKHRNAIKILELNDYPGKVISEALEISQKLDGHNSLKDFSL